MATAGWWRRDADVEQIRGLVVLLLATASLVVALLMVLSDGRSPAVRAAWSLGTVAVALGAASSEWARRALRWTAAVALVLIGLIVLDIGRDALELQPATQAVHELEGMVSVLDALDRRLLPPALKSDFVKEGIAEACAAAKKAGVDPDDIPDEVEKVSPSTPCNSDIATETLAVSLAVARLRLANYRVAVLGRDEDRDAVEALTAALEDAQASAGNTGDSGASFEEALQAGGSAILNDLPGQRPAFPLTLEVIGWTLLGTLSLAGWRAVERRSGQQMPGPVTINPGSAEAPAEKPADPAAGTATPPGGQHPEGSSNAKEPPTASSTPDSSADKGEVQQAVFRAALLRNLPEPTAAPGADAFASITDLVELSGATTMLGRIATALRGIITKPGGFIVGSEVLPPVNKGESWTVLVRISDQTTGRQLAVKSLSGVTATAACRVAGYWAAADILSRSTRIPSWASWSPQAAESLAAYDNVVDKLSAPEFRPELLKALAHAPTSGLLLNELGNRYEFDGQHLDALILYARAVAVHPRYIVARYRMAAAAGMLRGELEKQWFGAPLSKRVAVTDALVRACGRLKLDVSHLCGHGLQELAGADPAVASRMLKELTVVLLDRLANDASRVQLVARALRRSERIFWWPRVWSIGRLFGAAAQDEWLARSAGIIEACNDADPCPDGTAVSVCGDLAKVTSRAQNPHSWWQLSYNLACHHARQGNTEQAQHWLEVALERPGSGQLADGWLEEDPDLKILHGAPRFEAVLAQTRTSTGGFGG